MIERESMSFALRLNIFVLRITRNWLRIFLTVLAVYISLPWVAPTLMMLGAEGPGRAIYQLYRPFCHQFAFRSFFLYGEQPVYPLANTGTDLIPYEAYISRSVIPLQMRAGIQPVPPFNMRGLPAFTGINVADDIAPSDSSDIREIANFAAFQIASGSFLGTPQMGYKMTLCERDIAIYTALFIGGLIYSIPVVRRRLRPVPLWLYAILGLAPIGIDGVSQLLSYPPIQLWPPRETLPLFRVLTGALFGLMNAWLALPYFEMSMQDTQQDIEEKLREREITVP
jgi:uncharacterized membrane protein